MTFDWATATKELAKPLDPSAVKPPPQGKFGEYVDGLHVISEANRIFGRDGWSYTVTRLECASNQIFETPKGPQVRVAYVCAVRVDVAGVIREGLACGTGNGKPENVGDVIESAVKEAETDALKRALRTFGNTFGLALYEKDKAKREVGYAQPDVTPAEIDNALQYINDADIAALTRRLAGTAVDYKELYEAAKRDAEEAEAYAAELEAKLDTMVAALAYEGRRTDAAETKLAKAVEAAIDAGASLAAAISLLEKGSKKAAPSNKMFDQMLADYRASLERTRTTLAELK